MPNTKSAERRARQSAQRHAHNQSIKTRLKTLEKRFLQQIAAANRAEAAKTLRDVASALDKAAKTGVIHSRTASRKKSRLALRLRPVAA